MVGDKIFYRGSWQYSIAKSFVCNSTISRDARFLFIVLKSYTNDTKKEAFPSRELLKKIMRCSERSLSSYLKELINSGFVSVKQERDENKKFAHNIYTLCENSENSRAQKSTIGDNKNIHERNFDDTAISTSNKDPLINNIFFFWNEKNIKPHRKLTDAILRKINSSLRDYSEAEIKIAISNYSYILDSNEHFFSYRWTLTDFLRTGIEKFLDLEIAKSNYQKQKNEVNLINEKTLNWN